MSRLVLVLFVIVCMVIALCLYRFDSDAAFAVHDAIWYGVGAEEFPAGSINPHHPLFHVFVIAFVPPLRALGVEGPGHIATRIVAGLGGAWLLLQICALAGRRRILVGAAFALGLLCTRGFLIEMAGGENVLPAAAAALLAVTIAARPNPKLFASAAALTFALLLRQDNLFLIPGVAAAIALGRPKGTRLRGVFWVMLGAGLATVAGYAAAWWISTGGGQESPDVWLLRFGREGSWTGPKHFDWSRLPVYLNSFAVAATGRLWPVQDDHPLRGVAYLAAFLVPGLMLRGSAANLRLSVPILITLIGRALFHSWYEADNYEWLVLPLAFVVAFSAGLARGEPATPLPLRRAGVGILLALAVWFLIAHGADSWKLRERNLMMAIEEAADVDRTKWRFLAYGARVGEGLFLLGVPYEDVSPKGTDVDAFFRRLAEQLERHPVPTTVIADRFVMDGMPHTARNQWPWSIDTTELPGWTLIRRDGRAYAGRWTPPGPETRPESRR